MPSVLHLRRLRYFLASSIHSTLEATKAILAKSENKSASVWNIAWKKGK